MSSSVAKPVKKSAEYLPTRDPARRMVKGAGRPVKIVAFEEDVVEFFLESASLLSVPKSVAVVYGICFSSPAPLCFSDVRERLNISAGSISHGLRVLSEIGALRIVRSNLSRREFFVPEVHLGKLVKHFLDQRLQRPLDWSHPRLRAIGDRVPEGDAESVKLLKARLNVLRTSHGKMEALLPLVRRFLNLACDDIL